MRGEERRIKEFKLSTEPLPFHFVHLGALIEAASVSPASVSAFTSAIWAKSWREIYQWKQEGAGGQERRYAKRKKESLRRHLHLTLTRNLHLDTLSG